MEEESGPQMASALRKVAQSIGSKLNGAPCALGPPPLVQPQALQLLPSEDPLPGRASNQP